MLTKTHYNITALYLKVGGFSSPLIDTKIDLTPTRYHL